MKIRVGLSAIVAILVCSLAMPVLAQKAQKAQKAQAGSRSYYAGAPASIAPAPDPQAGDGFDQLPAGRKGLSMSTLVKMGLVHPQKIHAIPSGVTPINAPLSTITWGAPANTSQANGGLGGPNEPATGMNATNGLYAVVSGNNFTNVPCDGFNNTSDGGLTWTVHPSPSPCGYGDGTNAWLPGNFNGGHSVLEVSLNPSADGADLTTGISTDDGVTWNALASNLDSPQFDDRQYVWADTNPASPFYGHTYVTEALFDSAGSGSYNTVTVKMSSDGGSTWTADNPLVDHTEFATGTNHNEYPSLAILPNGDIVAAWHRGSCCGIINVDNKVAVSRSTDGGLTWSSGDPAPAPGTVVDVPLNQTISFNSTSPGGFRWSDTPNISADPSDGTLYVVWVQYRTANTAASAAVYLSKSTDEGNTWSAPVIPFNDPDPNIFQYMPWVSVSKDHAVHVTYSGGVGNNTTLAHFYVQSTDGGATFSAPFMLSSGTYAPAGFMGDYQGNIVAGYANGSATILAGWTDTNAGQENQWARMGTFPVALCGTYTPTSTPPSSGTLIYAGVTDTGNHCDDCTTPVALPFTFTFHGTPYTSVNVDSNGTLQFGSSGSTFTNSCLPNGGFIDTIFPYWDDQRTDNVNHAGEGIFTSVSGNAPNRIFNIEWRTEFFSGGATNNYEVRLYEDEDRFDVIYGTNASGDNGASATAGVQVGDGSAANSVSQFSCNAPGLLQNLMNTYTESCCPVLHTVGDMTNEDPLQVGRMFRDGNPSACGAPKACPGPFDANNHSYDIYPMFNGNNVSECVTVSVDSGGCALSVFAVAYIGSFDPSNICANYAADSGSSPSAAGATGGSASDGGGPPTNVAAPFSFDVPPQTAFYIVINEVNTYPSFCSGYTLDVTTSAIPTAVAGPDVTICQGGSANLSGSGGVTCSWTPTAGLSDPNSCTPSASPASTTTYTLTVADACGVTSTNNPTTTVTVNPGSAPVITPSGPTTFCAGGSVTLDAGAGYSSYSWSPGGQTTQTIVVTASGSYSVTVGGCGATSAPVVVTVNPNPNPVASGSATTCPGVGVPLTGSGGISCSWSPTTGLSDPNSCTPIASPSSTTTYTLTVTDANGCSSDQGVGLLPNGDFETGDLTDWTVDGTSNPPVNSTAQHHGGTHSVLLGNVSGGEPLGDSALYQTYTVPAAGGALTFWYWTFTTDSITFDWQDAYIEDTSGNILQTIFHQCSNNQAWVQQTFDLTPYAGLTIRIRFLVHQDGFGDDTAMYVDDVMVPTSAQVTVTVNPGPTAVAGGGGAICLGGSVGLTGSGGVSCSWTPVTGLDNPNSCTPNASPNVTTVYTLTVTDAGGCQSTNGPTATVTITPAPAPVITVSHCLTPNTSGQTASVPANAGDAYAWTITGGTIDSGQGTDTISFTSGGPATLMTLSVNETNVSGCTGSTADSMQVNFNDVPVSNPFYTFICTIARHAITAGCGAGNFCPANNVLRSQMAVFILRGEHGSVYVPPPAVGIFSDVLPSNPFAPWIEQLYNEQITGGCSTNPLMYCPNNSVSRAGMAVFLLVAEHGTGYVPPACSGIFTDVTCPGPFTNFIEQLYNEGITGGCNTNPLQYCPNNSVTRAQMSVFLTVTFNLP